MKTNLLLKIWVIILIAQFPVLLAAVEKKTSGNETLLSADKVHQIQNISQNVLTAKHSTPVNPELPQLKQRLEELRQAVANFHDNISTPYNAKTLPVSSGTDSNGDKLRLEAENNSLKEREALKTKVTNALDKVRQQRTRFESFTKSTQNPHRALEQNVASILKNLENELEDALQNPSDTSKMRKIRDSLVVSGPIAKRSIGKAETPTISTIVHHRD